MQYEKTRFLTAGEFAQICGINKQTLLYYEKIGLFVPSSKNENGRRYYSPEQIDTFHVILALRKIMSLNELIQYILTRKTESFLCLYDHCIQNLTTQIAYFEQQRSMMQKKLELIQEAKHIDTSIIYTQYCSAELLKLSPNAHYSSSDSEIVSALGTIIQYRTKHNICLGRAIGGILPTAWLECQEDPGYQYYYSELIPCASQTEPFVKPEGNYIIYYHRGDYHSTYLSYPKILEYANLNHFNLKEWVYEESLIDETVELDPKNYITKVSVQFAL